MAALSILVFHCWDFSAPGRSLENPFFPPLQSGVTLFFVLSGFLLYRSFAAAVLRRQPRPRLGPYLRNRALRIFPAYWVVLLLSALVLRSALAQLATRSFGAITSLETLGQDALLVQNYHPRVRLTGILPAWSLTTEVAFYLLLPLLAALAFRRLDPRRAIWLPPATLVALGIGGKIAVAALSPGSERAVGADWHGVIASSLATHADVFGLGMAAGALVALGEAGERRPLDATLRVLSARLLAYFGLPFVFLGYSLTPGYAYDTVVAVLCAALVLRVVQPSARRRLVDHRWLRSCGQASYSIFLWHYPVLAFLQIHGLLVGRGNPLALPVNIATAGAVVGVLAYVTHRLVEAPALRWKLSTTAGRGQPAQRGRPILAEAGPGGTPGRW